MGARKNDRRVLRTQQLLRAALLSLVEEKGFEELTVQDIIDRANVGRAIERQGSGRRKVARGEPGPCRSQFRRNGGPAGSL